jgi:hypothetical protein
VFPREQVHVIVFNDLARDVASAYRNALAFLGLPPDGRKNFETVNEAKSVRFARLGLWAARFKPAAMRTAVGIRRMTGLNAYGLLKSIEQLNQVKAIKPPLPTHLALELQHYFESDVVLLSSLLGRDLRDWTRATVGS